MSATVSYKGETLTTVNNATKTLLTEGKYLEDDITIVDVTQGGSATLIEKSINANGVYNASSDSADGYSKVVVSVPASAVDTGTKNITANGNNQDVVGYAAVNVNVPNTYAAGDEGKVVSNGALVSQTAHAEVTQNGTIDTTLNNSVTVNVSGAPSNAIVTTINQTNAVTDYKLYYQSVPNFLLNYVGYSLSGSGYTPPTITFGTKPTYVGKYAFFRVKAIIDWSGLSDMVTADEYALSPFYDSSLYDYSDQTVSLPSFVGYTAEHSAINLLRSDFSQYAPKKYILPVCAIIPQYAWYQTKRTDLDITIGSVGHTVTESKQQPFGVTTNATGTIVIYTDGSHLDTVKTAVMNGAGSNLTFTFKASENTTYGGSSYNAGDTILTA